MKCIDNMRLKLANRYAEKRKFKEELYLLKYGVERPKKQPFNLFDSFMKLLVFIIVIHGIICVSMSYVLAFMGQITIAEQLSSTVVQEIIAPLLAYGVKATIENVSKFNTWVQTFSANKYGETPIDDTETVG